MPLDIDSLQRKNSWVFNGGEVGVNISTDAINLDRVVMTSRIQNSNDLMKLLLTVDAMKRSKTRMFDTLFIPYLPYARQDRVADEGDPHALAVFCKIIDDLGFNEIGVIDAHSTVAESAFVKSRFVNIKPTGFINKYLDIAHLGGNHNLYFVSPDAGATKKTMYYADKFKEIVADVIFCGKIRNPADGKLGGFNIQNDVKLHNNEADIVILDDICDGGATFLGLAQALKE